MTINFCLLSANIGDTVGRLYLSGKTKETLQKLRLKCKNKELMQTVRKCYALWVKADPAELKPGTVKEQHQQQNNKKNKQRRSHLITCVNINLEQLNARNL